MMIRKKFCKVIHNARDQSATGGLFSIFILLISSCWYNYVTCFCSYISPENTSGRDISLLVWCALSMEHWRMCFNVSSSPHFIRHCMSEYILCRRNICINLKYHRGLTKTIPIHCVKGKIKKNNKLVGFSERGEGIY